MRRNRLGILVSGNGSTMQSLIESSHLSALPVVISNQPKAYAVIRARRFGCPVYVLPDELREKGRRKEAEAWIQEILVKHKVNQLFLAGFMWILSDQFVAQWEGRLWNIHPSLLPAYKGVRGFEQAFEAGEKNVGVTIHGVVAELDSGPTVLQRKFEVPDRSDITKGLMLLRIQESRVLREFVKGLWRSQRM